MKKKQMTNKNTTFVKWHKEVVRLAASSPNPWLASPDKEDHRMSYDDGMTPEEELDLQFSYAV